MSKKGIYFIITILLFYQLSCIVACYDLFLFNSVSIQLYNKEWIKKGSRKNKLYGWLEFAYTCFQKFYQENIQGGYELDSYEYSAK